MTSENIKSSEELKDEVREQLGKVDADINQMQERLSPGQLIDDMIFYPRGANVGSTIDLMRNNPIGSTFLTLGTLLLTEDDQHRTYEQRAKSQGHEILEEGRAQLDDLKGKSSSEESLKKLDPMMYVAAGAGLGALAGLSLPITETEQHIISDRVDGMASIFTHDLQDALNESAGILKDLVISDLKSINVDIFHR